MRYRKGKSDPTDAEMAARTALAGVADATPQSGEGEVEMIRMLKSTKDSAVNEQSLNVVGVVQVATVAKYVLHGYTVGNLGFQTWYYHIT